MSKHKYLITKNKYLSCRVKEEEYNIIKELLKEKNLKVYDLIYYATHDLLKKDKMELIKQFTGVARNINQVVKLANTTKSIENKTIKELKKELLKLKKIIYDI